MIRCAILRVSNVLNIPGGARLRVFRYVIEKNSNVPKEKHCQIIYNIKNIKYKKYSDQYEKLSQDIYRRRKNVELTEAYNDVDIKSRRLRWLGHTSREKKSRESIDQVNV